jgi:hypothetical protein
MYRPKHESSEPPQLPWAWNRKGGNTIRRIEDGIQDNQGDGDIKKTTGEQELQAGREHFNPNGWK